MLVQLGQLLTRCVAQLVESRMGKCYKLLIHTHILASSLLLPHVSIHYLHTTSLAMNGDPD